MLSQYPKKDDPRNYRPFSVSSATGRIQKIILGIIERHLKNNTVMGHSQHDFNRGESSL